jgi:hypothetical protein
MQIEKLKKNLSYLRKQIKRKPKEYEPDYALTFDGSFDKYTRTSTINLISAFSELLFEYRWPFPAFYLEFSSRKHGTAKFILVALVLICVLKMKKLARLALLKPEATHEIFLRNTVRDLIIISFPLYEKDIFIDWKKNHIFQGKSYLIDNIRSCYKKELWYACITAAFPLLDLLCRKYFNSNRLDRDISLVISAFNSAGITSKSLKPGAIAWEVANEQGESGDKAIENDLRLIGIGLGSFLDFASIYYDWYRKDNNAITELNRHAIIHCASTTPSSLWTKENATKLIIFIDLALRLEKPLCILLKED